VSLRLRLIISIGLGLLASLAFGGTIAFWNAARQVETEMRSAMVVAERVALAAIGDSSRGVNQYQRLEHLIRQFDDDRHVQAMVVDRKNEVVLASRLASPSTHVPDWFRRSLDRGSAIAQIKLSPASDDGGVFMLKTDSANELAEKWGDISLALAVLVVFCTFVLGLVYWTLASGLRPLQALNAAFDRVGRGDYSPRAPESGAAELAHLARQFNQMAMRLTAMQLQNTRLNEQLAKVQDEERAELARELHDEIGPFLFAVGLDIATIHQTLSTNGDVSAQLEPRLESVRAALAHMQKHLKIILGRLRPTAVLDLGLAQAMDNLIDFWRTREPNVAFNLKVIPESFGDMLDEGIYRIAREGLSNALRHGHPTKIDINVRSTTNDTVEVEIIDDGGGMKSSNGAVGFGITGMQERAALLGGTISVQDRSDRKGVVVSARFPCQKSAALRAADAGAVRT
jgi:two-component system, NarL family, sensor histidine kinase UhpB